MQFGLKTPTACRTSFSTELYIRKCVFDNKSNFAIKFLILSVFGFSVKSLSIATLLNLSSVSIHSYSSNAFIFMCHKEMTNKWQLVSWSPQILVNKAITTVPHLVATTMRNDPINYRVTRVSEIIMSVWVGYVMDWTCSHAARNIIINLINRRWKKKLVKL